MSGAGIDRDEGVAIARLGAAAAAGDPARVGTALDDVEPFLGPEEIEELLLQTYLFAGFPRAIEALVVWRGRSNGSAHQPEAPENLDAATWRERGERVGRLVYGERYEQVQAWLEDLHPAVARWTLVEGYGKTLARPALDLARRELAAVGALAAIGADRQLASHLRGALHSGVARAVLEAAARAAAPERAERVARLVDAMASGFDAGRGDA